MEKYISLPYPHLFQNYIEIEYMVKICINCNTKILSNSEFVNKKPEDELANSNTICGFCYNCKHHVLPSDCYTKIEHVKIIDNSINFMQIYNNNYDPVYSITNPLLKN